VSINNIEFVVISVISVRMEILAAKIQPTLGTLLCLFSQICATKQPEVVHFQMIILMRFTRCQNSAYLLLRFVVLVVVMK